jgi:hypothetical protein
LSNNKVFYWQKIRYRYLPKEKGMLLRYKTSAQHCELENDFKSCIVMALTILICTLGQLRLDWNIYQEIIISRISLYLGGKFPGSRT